MNPRELLGGRVVLHRGDCMTVLPTLGENSVDAVVTDPPYHFASIVKRWSGQGPPPVDGVYRRSTQGFMGKEWDGGDIAFRPDTWAAVLRVLKPGGHLLAFGAPKNAHRLTCAIEDAGFEIRDTLMWLFGSGFPKSHDVSKGIAKRLRRLAEQAAAWSGWGTALKPAYEPICLARKPLEGTVAENVLKWGTGAINIDGCRVGTDDPTARHTFHSMRGGNYENHKPSERIESGGSTLGRWPANILHDGSEEVVGAFPETSSGSGDKGNKTIGVQGYGSNSRTYSSAIYEGDSGSAARFFYASKADSDDRIGSKHPTVKPLDLMQYLVRLVTPPKGVVLDPFAGTGTTGEAAWREGFSAILIEREPEYIADIERRIKLCLAGPDERAREAIKARTKDKPVDHGPLFGEVA